jgi:hypothetical protein
MTRTAGEAGAGEAAPEELGGGGLEAALLAASGAVRAACLREVRQVEAFYERRLAQLEREHEALARGLMEENSRLVHERAALQETVSALRAELELMAVRARPAAAAGSAPIEGSPPRRQQLDQQQQLEPRPLSLYERERLKERLARRSLGSQPERLGAAAAPVTAAPSACTGDELNSSAPHRDLLAEIDRSLLGNATEKNRQEDRSLERPDSTNSRGSSSGLRPASPSLASSPFFSLSSSPMDLSARGRAFFRQARTQLSEHDYECLVAAMKDLNRGAQTRGETAALAKRLLGAGGRQLGADFEDLLEGRSRDHGATAITDLL